jgi:adenine-specific DNA-methyltransferase
VLTDFAQFQVLDCRYKPDINSALQCAVKTYHYSDYENPEKFAEIFYLFSRDAVVAGSLEKFTKDMPKRRGKAVQRGLFPGAYKGIDDAFLEDLDEYRRTLAHMFKDADTSLDGETLTEITQRTIDRLVFTRFLEDRQIEPEPIVARFGEKGHSLGRFPGRVPAAGRHLQRHCFQKARHP